MMQMPMNMNVPNMEMMPNMGMSTMNPSSGNIITNVNNYENEINRLEQRINMLERRISALESSNTSNNNYNNYNSSGYQML